MKVIYTFQITRTRTPKAQRRHDPSRDIVFMATRQATNKHDALLSVGIKPGTKNVRCVIVGTSFQ